MDTESRQLIDTSKPAISRPLVSTDPGPGKTDHFRERVHTKGGMFDLAGIDISQIQAAVGATSRVMNSARRSSIKIVYLTMPFRGDLSDLGSSDSKNRLNHMRLNVGKVVRAPVGSESRILFRDKWNGYCQELTPHADDVVVYKHRFSGFFQTDLDAMLKKLGVKHLIVTGCTTSVCVESTVKDAMFRDYTPVVLADCAAEPIGHELPRSNHMASLLTIETTLGWVFDSEKVTKALDDTDTAEECTGFTEVSNKRIVDRPLGAILAHRTIRCALLQRSRIAVSSLSLRL